MIQTFRLAAIISALTLSSTIAKDLVILPGDDPNEAIAAARPGDVVIFEEGKHYVDKGGVIVADKRGITILGENAEVFQRGTTETVMTLTNCVEVTIRDLYLAHDPEVTKELCLGGVLEIDASDAIVVENTELDGCGAWAISATDVIGLTVRDSKASHNSAGVFWIFDSKDVSITNTLVSKNYESKESDSPLPVLYASNTKGLTFTDNIVRDNGNRMFDDISDDSTKVVIKNNDISGNAFENAKPPTPPKPPKPKPGDKPLSDPDGLLDTVESAYEDGDYIKAAQMAMTVLAMDPDANNETTAEFYAISASAMLAHAREVERGDAPDPGAAKPPAAADYYRYSAFFNRALATALLAQLDDKVKFQELYGELLQDYAPLPPWVQLPE